jgi:hypothetical protein
VEFLKFCGVVYEFFLLNCKIMFMNSSSGYS